MPYLPVDTAVVVEVGPLLDSTDGQTLETGIAHNEAGMSVDLFKNSGTLISKVDITPTTGGVNDWLHEGSAVYSLEITAPQNDTKGTLRVVGICDGVLVFESPIYTVVPVAVYNSLILGSDALQVKLASDGWDAVMIEPGINARQALSIIGAATGGELSGAQTSTVLIMGLGTLTTRITAEVDGAGNRDIVTLTPPA